MRSNEAELHFPVLGISEDNDVWGFWDFRGLTTCGPLTLRDKMQIGMELIDARGTRWRVRQVNRVGRAGSILSQILNVVLAGKPQFRIEQDLQELSSASLADVQERVCAAMQAHPDFWCEQEDRGTVLPARLNEVRSTQEIAEIHDVLGLDTFENY